MPTAPFYKRLNPSYLISAHTVTSPEQQMYKIKLLLISNLRTFNILKCYIQLIDRCMRFASQQ